MAAPVIRRLPIVLAPRVTWWHGWAPLVMMPGGVLLFAPSTWPAWAVMWTLAFTIYAGCKWLTWRRTPLDGVPRWRHAAYLLAWPGLDAAAFLSAPVTRSPAAREWISGAALFACGVALLFGAARLIAPQHPAVAAWVGMIGIVLTLHFGIFRVLSCGWRALGVEARPLMDRPLASVSLSEFWGRRWNTAFRDLTHRFLFRPLTTRVGARWAILGGFVFSGLVHELVISVPAAGGYGAPTIFFTLQAIGMLVERTGVGRRIGLGQRWSGWAFAMFVLVAPVYLLFHPPFVGRIVLPFMRALRAM